MPKDIQLDFHLNLKLNKCSNYLPVFTYPVEISFIYLFLISNKVTINHNIFRYMMVLRVRGYMKSNLIITP